MPQEIVGISHRCSRIYSRCSVNFLAGMRKGNVYALLAHLCEMEPNTIFIGTNLPFLSQEGSKIILLVLKWKD